jgi:hypothetical protein
MMHQRRKNKMSKEDASVKQEEKDKQGHALLKKGPFISSL